MEQINRHCENAHIIMGAGIQEEYAGRLSVTLVASRQNAGEELARAQPVPSQQRHSEPTAHEHDICNPRAAARPASRHVPPAPILTQQQAERLLTSQAGGSLEIVSKGRFEKSEPTIHQGEDLDVPTYIRRGVALN